MWISNFVFRISSYDINATVKKHEIRNPHSEIRNSFTGEVPYEVGAFHLM